MSLKVIGAGLGRTGTLSLKVALEQLGFMPCYHMIEVFAGMPATLPLWEAATRGEPDWDAIFAGYSATADYPGCTFWRELIAEYPRAKVILSRRDPDKWFDSVSKTIFSAGVRALTADSPAREFFERIVFADFDPQQIADRAFMTDYFERWNAAVIAEVPPERLLVFEAKQGWEPLCAFLGVPVPDAPYPRLNSSDEWAERGSTAPATPAAPPTLEQMAEVARMRLAATRTPPV